jgi:hypothetical protein
VRAVDASSKSTQTGSLIKIKETKKIPPATARAVIAVEDAKRRAAQFPNPILTFLKAALPLLR